MKDYKFEFMDYCFIGITVAAASLLVLAMTACSSDDEPVAAGFPCPLAFEAMVDDVDETRASNTANGTWAANDIVAVSVDNGTAKQYKISTAAASSSMSGKDASNTFWWTADGQTKAVRAWFYGDGTYRANCTSAWTMPTSQTATDIQNKDFLYASNSLTYSSGSTYTLNFYHQLSKVTVNIKYSNDANVTNNALTAITLTANIYPTGTFTKPAVSTSSAVTTHGTWAASGTAANVTPASMTAASGYSYTYSALLIPQTFASSSKLVLTMTFTSLGTFTYDTGLTKPAAGQHYVYNVTVNKENVKVLASTINWRSTSTVSSTVYYKN